MIKANPANMAEYLACCGLLELSWMFHPGQSRGRFVGQTFELSSPSSPQQLIERLVLRTKLVPHYDSDGKLLSIDADIDGQPLVLDWFTSQKYKGWSGRDNAYQIFMTSSALSLGVCLSAKDYWPNVGPVANVLDVIPSGGNSKHFSLDRRRAAVANDVGFSANDTGDEVPAYTYTELLAAIGMQRFRPSVNDDDEYSYFVWSRPLPAPVATVASLCSPGTAYQCVRKKTSKSGKVFTLSQGVSRV